jgi:hypothetical protein
VKFHSSSSGFAFVSVPARSSSDEGAGGRGLAELPEGSGLGCRGLADTNDANGSAAGGGVAVAFWRWENPGTGVDDLDGGWDKLNEPRISKLGWNALEFWGIWGFGGPWGIGGLAVMMLVNGLQNSLENILGPSEIPPEGSGSSMDNPSKSFSRELEPCGCSALPLELGSGSKSIRDSSLLAFLDTPVVVPKVPLGIFDAASWSPFFTSLYRWIVRCMLSLISSNLCTASGSSDSSSHIFWILGCAL